MPAILLGVLCVVIGIVGIIWLIIAWLEFDVNQMVGAITATTIVLAVLVGWLLTSLSMPLAIDYEGVYNPVVSSYENGTKIQTICINSRIINVNNIIGGYLVEDKAVKRVCYKEWYAGLWYPIEYKYFIVDKVKEKNEKSGAK